MRLMIVGARADGQAHLALEALEEGGEHEVVACADETPELAGQVVLGRPVLGDLAEAALQLRPLGIEGAVIAVGVPAARVRLAEACRALGLALPTVAHPTAYVSRYARLGEGVFLGAGVQVLPGAEVGDLVIAQAAAVISHHTRLGRACNLGPNATLAGRSSLEEQVFVGAGAVVLPEVHVGAGSIVGAGAVVTRDVAPNLTVVGVPARPLERR